MSFGADLRMLGDLLILWRRDPRLRGDLGPADLPPMDRLPGVRVLGVGLRVGISIYSDMLVDGPAIPLVYNLTSIIVL